LIAFVICSCDKSSPDCFKKAGKESHVERTLTPFKTVTLESNIEVVLRKGNEHRIEISGPKNLLEKVVTSVSDGTLTIDNNNGCNFVRGYKHHLQVIVYAPEYDMIISNSIGNMRTEEGFVQDTIFFYTEGGDMIINGTFAELKTGSHGNGNIYFNGLVDHMYVYMNGTNYLYAENGTIINYIFIETLSLADAFITAPNNGTINYHTWKTGNIYYSGDPATVDGKQESTGGAIKK
jgi:hypothetical protein